MARMVTVTITYDMDDEEKTLADELKDWVEGNISVQDLEFSGAGWPKTGLTSSGGSTVCIK